MSQNQSLNDGRIQPDDDLVEYEVTWAVELTSHDAENAARAAAVMIADASSIAHVFTVRALPNGEPIEIDLDRIDGNPEL